MRRPRLLNPILWYLCSMAWARWYLLVISVSYHPRSWMWNWWRHCIIGVCSKDCGNTWKTPPLASTCYKSNTVCALKSVNSQVSTSTKIGFSIPRAFSKEKIILTIRIVIGIIRYVLSIVWQAENITSIIVMLIGSKVRLLSVLLGRLWKLRNKDVERVRVNLVSVLLLPIANNQN